MGDYKADFLLDFQGLEANNHLETITGFTDNTVGQFEVLIDWGFLQL
ncbi:MAG: hypothetical protein ACJAZJ_001399 [Candidatus Endobugula sp.]|jgi:hypothetical protein